MNALDGLRRLRLPGVAVLSNAFGKKIKNHMHAVSLHFMYYNFAHVHKTLRVTPAMEAGVTAHVWMLAAMLGHDDRANRLRQSMPYVGLLAQDEVRRIRASAQAA